MRKTVAECDFDLRNPGMMLLIRGSKDVTSCLPADQNVWRAAERTSESWRDGWSSGDGIKGDAVSASLVADEKEQGVYLHLETRGRMLSRVFDVRDAFLNGNDCASIQFVCKIPSDGFDVIPTFPDDTFFAMFFLNRTTNSGRNDYLTAKVGKHELCAYVYDPVREENGIIFLTPDGYGTSPTDNFFSLEQMEQTDICVSLRIYKNIMSEERTPRLGFVCQIRAYDPIERTDRFDANYLVAGHAFYPVYKTDFDEYLDDVSDFVNQRLLAYKKDIALISASDMVPDALSCSFCGTGDVKQLGFYPSLPAWMPEKDGEANLILDGVKITIVESGIAFDGVVPSEGSEIENDCVMSAMGGGYDKNKFSFSMEGTDLKERPILHHEILVNGHENEGYPSYFGCRLEDKEDGSICYYLASGANLHLYAVAAAATVTDSDGNVSYVEDLSDHIARNGFNSGDVVKVLLDSEVYVCLCQVDEEKTVFDLNGCTVGLFNYSEGATDCLFWFDDAGSDVTLTIRDSGEEQNGRFVARDDLSYVIQFHVSSRGNRKLEIEGGIFDARIGVYTEEYEVVQFTGVLECVTVVLTGGSFNKALFSTEGDEPTFTLAGCVADGYKYELKDGYYVVTKAA